MKKNFGIKGRLILGFSIAPLIMILLIVIGISQVNSIERSLTTINQVNSVKQRYAINFRGSVHDRAISLRDVVLNTDDRKAEEAIDEIKVLEEAYKNSAIPLDKIFSDQKVTTDEIQLLKDIKDIENKTLPLISKTIELRKNGQHAEALGTLLEQAKPAFITWLARINKFIDYQEKLNAHEARDAQGIAGNFQYLMLILCAVSLILTSLTGWLITRSIINPLSKVTVYLNTSSKNLFSVAEVISHSSQNLAEGATEQAATIEEISASVEDLANMTRKNASNAEACKSASNQARSAAEAGAREMSQMQAAMDSIQQSSNEISAIMDTIDGIAFQTNLLALNAAVEAARAGEVGAGFAVVANEVRNLAQRSAEAAKETATKIQTALERSSQGVALSKIVMAELKQIVDKNQQVDTIVSEVALSSHEQSEGLTQISAAINEMNTVTQSNVASASDNANTLESLNEQSSELRNAALQLSSLVGKSAEEA